MPDPQHKTISATQSPALWNVSPYFTRWMLWRHFADGLPLDAEPNARMDWGLKMQPLILQQAADELRLEVIPNLDNAYHRRGLLGCTRDATIICPDRGPGALETKCVFDYGVWMRDWGGGKTAPRCHEIQLQQQMMVGNGEGENAFDWGVIVAWVGADLFFFERKPIFDLWAKLSEEAAAFFKSVADKIEPNPFGAAVELPWLTELFPTEPGKQLDLSEDHAAVALAEDVSTYATFKAQESVASKGSEHLRAKLLALAKDNETVLLPCGVSYRVAKSGKGKTIKPFVPLTLKPPPASPERNILHGG